MIRVTQGNDKPTIVAISPIALNGIQIKEDIGRIVEADLKRSGLFSAIPRRDMLAFPAFSKDVYYRDWRMLGAEYLVVGSMALIEEDRYRLDFSLLNVTAQKTEFNHRVSGTKSQMRDLAHLISDKIYQEITGIRGAFSTRLAYVTANLEKFCH